MKVLGIRFCHVAHKDEAEGIAALLGANGFGLEAAEMGAASEGADFHGAVFPVDEGAKTGERSSIEIWPADEQMPEMTMLQIVVDDADAWAKRASENGVDVKGPDDVHGERIYYMEGPGGLPMAFLSKTA